MYIARHVTGETLEEIGREFGSRHHSMVLHSICKIEAMLISDRAMNRAITAIDPRQVVPQI